MGFDCKWVAWINWCISTASFSVHINDSLAGFFNHTRGLRQGDPLSPYLFVLGMEVFSLLVDKAVSGGFLTRYNLKGRNGDTMNLSYLLFENDTLVFYSASEDQIVYLSWIMLYFEALSRLKFNLEKSAILLVGDVVNIEQLACELGCKAGTLPSTHLGLLPLGIRQNSLRVWEGIEERFRRRLIAWKRDSTSLKGEGSRLSEALYPTYPFTLSPFFGCLRVLSTGWRKSKGTSYGGWL